jgi:hypothetical protein
VREFDEILAVENKRFKKRSMGVSIRERQFDSNYVGLRSASGHIEA